jgi:hypothetical protein
VSTKLRPDWSWQPDEKIAAALQRGQSKLAAFNARKKESMFNFNRSAVRRVSQHERTRRENDQREVRYYVGRREMERVRGSKQNYQPSVWADVRPTDRAVSKREREKDRVRSQDGDILSAARALRARRAKRDCARDVADRAGGEKTPPRSGEQIHELANARTTRRREDARLRPLRRLRTGAPRCG